MSARTANGSDIIPQVRVLKHAMKKMAADLQFTGLGSTISAVSRSMESRYSKYEEDEMLIAATFLDPRFKNTLYKESQENEKSHIGSITAFIQESLLKLRNLKKDHEEAISSGSTDEELIAHENVEIQSQLNIAADQIDSYDFNSCFDDLLSSTSPAIQSPPNPTKSKSRSDLSFAKLKKEIEMFSSAAVEPRTTDPLIWWRNNRCSYPELQQIATKMLCSPPSSVESERLFSIGGNVYTPHRNRLTPETGEQLMFLNFNMRVFDFNY